MFHPKFSAFFLSLFLCPTLLLAASKEHSWQTGITLDTGHNRYFTGIIHDSSTSGTVNASGTSMTSGNSTYSHANGTYSDSTSSSDTAMYRVYENYVIDSGTMVYLAEERLTWRWSKPALLTVNGPVKFYTGGRKIHILDEAGKEHEATIMKQILKPATPPSSNAIQ
jgi:hypothetical protein